MKIILNQIGKKFEKEWTFQNIDLTINSGEKWLVSGNNGSGKSTFIGLVSGKIKPSQGYIHYHQDETQLSLEDCYKYLSIASPSLDLFHTFSLEEIIRHHFSFKNIQKGIDLDMVPDILELSHAKNKALENFSSGMKQRVKLGLAILSDAPLLLLDEPLSNLDNKGFEWYKGLINAYALHKTILVASNNIEEEHFFCEQQINIPDFKTQ